MITIIYFDQLPHSVSLVLIPTYHEIESISFNGLNPQGINVIVSDHNIVS